MPILIGVGDTVTSIKEKSTSKWMRGGSDRGFLTLVQELGKAYNLDNRVIFVSSGNEEVFRPSAKNGIEGISDSEDPLKFDFIMTKGPNQYIDWLIHLSKKRSGIT